MIMVAMKRRGDRLLSCQTTVGGRRPEADFGIFDSKLMCNSNIGGCQSCTANLSDPAIVVSAAVLEDASTKTPFENGGPTQQRSVGWIASQMELIALGLPGGIRHPGNGHGTDSLPWRCAAPG